MCRRSGDGVAGAAEVTGHRRSLTGLSLLAVLAVLSASCAHARSSSSGDSPGHPNIVFLVVDDLDATLTPYWKAMPRTRALLADRGTTFSNGFVTDPLCCPSRASLLTGMYPHNTHVFNSYKGLEDFAGRGSKRTVGVRLQRAGYTTAFLGKYLNGYELNPSYVPAGWDEWFGLSGKNFLSGYSYGANHNGKMESFGTRPTDYQTDVLAREATSFIDHTKQKKGAKPFLLTLFPTAPHAPIGPAPRDKNNPFAKVTLPKRPNFNEADVSDKPRWLRDWYPKLATRDVIGETQHYRQAAGSLFALDDMVGSIEDHLRANGQLDNTVFIFSSDNGFSFGSHRIGAKLVPYDESSHVPMVIAGPHVRHGTTDQLATNIDLAATIYDLAGVPVPPDVDGKSLVPLLEGTRPHWRRDVLIEFRGTYNPIVHVDTLADVRAYFSGHPGVTQLIPDYRAVRSKQWLYVQWYAGADHDYELYDMAKDPYQMSNLLATPGQAARLANTTKALQARLEALASCSGGSCR